MSSSDEDDDLNGAETDISSQTTAEDEAQECEIEEGSSDAAEDFGEAEEAAWGDSDEEMSEAAAPRAPKKPPETKLAQVRQAAHEAAFMRAVLVADGGTGRGRRGERR